jgi:cobalt-zinc-cadmium resistance protein CzcA
MSLGAIDFGLIVDGSVVMIENVVRVVGERRKKGLPSRRGDPRRGREVAGPVTFAVGIIILVYLPLLGLTGIEGKMFRPMAATVVFALLGSLVFALVLMPVLAAAFLKGPPSTRPGCCGSPTRSTARCSPSGCAGAGS